MNYLKLITFVLFALILSCSKEEVAFNEDVKIKEVERLLELKEVKNIYAPYYDMTVHPAEKILTEEFVKFDFQTGKVIKEGDNWDIGFKGKKIIVNGGRKTKPINEPERTKNVSIAMVNGLFDEVKKIPINAVFKEDRKNILAISTGSGNGWYHYSDKSHIMSAIIGRIFIIKSRLGKYVKMEILSYYKDGVTNKPSSYYSFNYVINPLENDDRLY